MTTVSCFLVKPTEREHRMLRRFTFGDTMTCPGFPQRHGHDASVSWMDGAVIRTEDGYFGSLDESDWPSRSDPLWPNRCDSCEYTFQPEDMWQIAHDTYYRREDTSEEWLFRSLPAGAMFDAWWLPWKGPDEQSLTLVLPDGIPWHIDGPCTGSPRRPWSRTGVPPIVTARPSILTPGYHGFLTDGRLESC